MTELNKLFREELKLCGVGQGQRIAVLSEGSTLREYAEASLSAASALGAEVVDVHLKSDDEKDPNERLANIGRNSLGGNAPAMQSGLHPVPQTPS